MKIMRDNLINNGRPQPFRVSETEVLRMDFCNSNFGNGSLSTIGRRKVTRIIEPGQTGSKNLRSFQLYLRRIYLHAEVM